VKVLLKLGGSMITRKDAADFPLDVARIRANAETFIRTDVLKQAAAEIKEAVDGLELRLIIVNGAGPFGHFLVKSGAAEDDVRASVRMLNEYVVSELRNAGIDAVPIPPSESCTFDGERFDIDYLWEVAQMLLEEGKTPSTYGDMLADGKIISGDDLVALLAKKWRADRIIVATDVDGVYTKDPNAKAEASFVKQLRVADSGAKLEYTLNSIDITGGMQSKVEKLKGAAAAGIECRIINGMKPGNIKAALLGDEGFGTSIVA
jgi:isopentenyl phosphate kinase